MTKKKAKPKNTPQKKTPAETTESSWPAPTETGIYGHASDGEPFRCDRAQEIEQFWLWAGTAINGPEDFRGKALLHACFAALWHTVSDLSTHSEREGWRGGFNPWDIVQMFGECMGRFVSAECRTLGEAFEVPDHKGRTATYGPKRVKRNNLMLLREDAIFHDCAKRIRSGKTHKATFIEVGKLYGVGEERIRQVFRKIRAAYRKALGRDPLKG